MTPPQNSAEVAEAIGPTLDLFVLASAPMLRDCAEAVYEQLLYSVQDYLKANAEWNIGNEIDRCRKIEIENIKLRATIHQLGENAAKAAGEYAERVAAICKELALTELANIEGASDEWLAGFRHAVSRVEATLALDTLNVSNLARAALTEPTDG